MIHDVHEQWAMGEFGPCLFVIWKGPVTEAALLQIGERFA